MDHELELTCVRRCQGFDLAQIYKAKLEAVGIPVLLQYESAGPIYGITVDGLGQVRVLVPSEYAEDAKVLLTDLLEEEEWVEDESAVDHPETVDAEYLTAEEQSPRSSVTP